MLWLVEGRLVSSSTGRVSVDSWAGGLSWEFFAAALSALEPAARVEAAAAGDRAGILAMARRHEGEEAACWAEFWLDRQPASNLLDSPPSLLSPTVALRVLHANLRRRRDVPVELGPSGGGVPRGVRPRAATTALPGEDAWSDG